MSNGNILRNSIEQTLRYTLEHVQNDYNGWLLVGSGFSIENTSYKNWIACNKLFTVLFV